MKPSSVLNRYLALSLGIYVLAMMLGLLMRLAFVTPMPWLPFAHAIHAHSHTMYFGWVGLGILALAFRMNGDEAPFVRRLLGTIGVLAVVTFVSFLNGGYTPLSIVLSTTFLFIWAGALVRWWRGARGRSGLAYTYLRVGMVYLLIASMGAWGRMVVLALHVKEPIWGRLAVFAFLYNFGWFFVFGVVGLLIAWAPKWNIVLNERLLRWHLWAAAPVAWLTFPLGVPGGASFGVLGVTARVAAALLLVPGALLTLALVRGATTGRGAMKQAFGWLAFWYGLKTLLELGGALGLSHVAVATRHPAILYLHVFLLGFVTLALLLPVLAELKRPLGATLSVHNAGLVVMTLGLGVLSAPGYRMTFFVTHLRAGFIVAAIGAAIIVTAGVVWSWPRTLVSEERAFAGADVSKHPV